MRASNPYYAETGENETKCLLATPAANLCDCPYNAVGWTLIDGECTCELPANKTSGMRVIPVMIESQKKRDALAENNIDLDQIEERSLGCRFYQCDNMKNPVEQNGVCVCVDALGTGGWERDTTTLNEFEKKRDVSMEVDVSKPNGQVRALKGRGKCPFNNPFCEYFVPLNNGECACIPYLRGINQHVGRADKE